MRYFKIQLSYDTFAFLEVTPKNTEVLNTFLSNTQGRQYIPNEGDCFYPRQVDDDTVTIVTNPKFNKAKIEEPTAE